MLELVNLLINVDDVGDDDDDDDDNDSYVFHYTFLVKFQPFKIPLPRKRYPFNRVAKSRPLPCAINR